MKHVSRLLVLVLVLVTLFSGSAMAQTDKKVIGVCMIDFTNQFYIDMMEAGDIAAVDYNVTTL
jgi:ABC-type sugar transport system substrate-binding protein